MTKRRFPTSYGTVAGLLTMAGATVIILGVGASLCTIAANANDWYWWWGRASMMAMDMVYKIFGAGVLASLALICQRQSKPRGSRDKGT